MLIKYYQLIQNLQKLFIVDLYYCNINLSCFFLTRKLCYRKDDHVMCLIYDCPESLECIALAVPEIIAIGVLVGGCEP